MVEKRFEKANINFDLKEDRRFYPIKLVTPVESMDNGQPNLTLVNQQFVLDALRKYNSYN